MGNEWVQFITDALSKSGIAVMEAYPAGMMLHLEKPAAAVEMKALNCAEGKVMIGIRVLSPQSLGGWECQNAAACVAGALYDANIDCTCAQMEYLQRSDCFCVLVTAKIPVHFEGGKWVKGSPWEVSIGNQKMEYATRFYAEQNQDRRLIGAVCQSQPVGVTSGTNSGWKIRLVQKIPFGKPIPSALQEPFSLTVRKDGQTQQYRNCYWSGEKCSHSQAGMELEQWGYALERGLSNGKNEV